MGGYHHTGGSRNVRLARRQADAACHFLRQRQVKTTAASSQCAATVACARVQPRKQVDVAIIAGS